MNLNTVVEFLARKARRFGFLAGMLLVLVIHLPSATFAQDGIDGVTGFARDPVHVAAWPGGRKVAVSFALFVEEFGFGQGPVLRPDLANRNPDLVNEAFRQYAIDWGIARVGRLFKELEVPLSVVLNAEFPGKHGSVWKELRATQPNAPIIAHGMNNTSRMLPLGRGLDEQRAYSREARAEPAREATTVVIGIHPFVIGTPDGAAALRRVLSRLKKEDAVWLSDTGAILAAAGLK